MNLWLAASVGLSLALIPCAFMCFSASPERRLVGIQMTGLLLTILFVAITLAFGYLRFIDVAVALALCAYGGGLFYARSMEKHS
jgi:multisubunit Na+/H+ antiporter MnhF subunit